MIIRLAALVVMLGACGTQPSAPPVPLTQPQPEPTPGGPCTTTEHRGTCGFVGAEESAAPMAGEVVLTARYRLISAQPPSADGGPSLIVHAIRVDPRDADEAREHFWRHPEVPCRYWGMTGSCAAPDPVVDVPPFAPRGSAPALRPSWPTRICAVPTSGVPSAIRALSCNCGERLECRVRIVGGQPQLDVLEDPRTSTRCRDCIAAEATCPILRPLEPGRATILVNGRLEIGLDTTAAGLLPEGRCWDVPPPPSGPPGR